MNDLKHVGRWAWRWSNTNEPAFIAYSLEISSYGRVLPLLRAHSNIIPPIEYTVLDTAREWLMAAGIHAAQWEMWFEFELCPCIEIYEWTEHTFKCRLVKPHGH